MWCARAVLRCRPIKCGTADPLNWAMKKWNSRRGAALSCQIQRQMVRVSTHPQTPLMPNPALYGALYRMGVSTHPQAPLSGQ